MADDLGGQLKIQQDINKALQQRGALLSAQNQQLSGQALLYKEICSAMECEDLDGMTERLGAIQEGLRGAASEADNAGGSIESGMSKGQKSAEKTSKTINKGISKGLSAAKVAAIGFGVGLVSGLRSTAKHIKGLVKSLGNVTKSLFNVGKAVISIPFKMMSGLIGMAQSGGGGGPNPIKVALEEIRGEFGDLASNEGQAVASAFTQLKGQMNDLGGTGIKLSKVFGRGKAGMAEAMKYVSEIAKAAGPALNGLLDVFKESAGVLAAYTKGLTGSAEGTAAILKHFKAMGDDPVEAMDKMASQAVLMGKQFGVAAKAIGKNMSDMVKDVSHFGHLSVKELAATATYAAKLGIEIKDLGAVTDKFLNFEDAAQGAAQLQQAFGMTVDSMELMKGGAASIDALRKGFHNAGKSIKDMSLAERKLLETQTGLNGAALDAAFAADKQGLSYEELTEAAGDNEEKQLTQAEAMKELSDSIQKTFGGGGGGKTFKSFFDAFVQGFTKGIKKSSEFRKVMRNIRKSLKIVYRAGIDIGKMFVKMFPGVKQMLSGLAGLFDPAHYQKLMRKVKDIFRQFFTDIRTDPKAGTETFIERMKQAFKDFFGDRKGAASELKEGFKTFAKTMGAIFKVLAVLAYRGLIKLFNKIAETIRNPPEVPQGVKELRDKLGKALVDMWHAIRDKYLPPIWEAMKSVFMALWEKAKPYLAKVGKLLLKVAIAKMLVAAVLSALKSGIAMLLVKAIAGFFAATMGAGAAAAAPVGAAGAAQTGALQGFFKSLAMVSAADILMAAAKLFLITTVFMPAFVLFVLGGLVVIYKALSSVDPVRFALLMFGLSYGILAIKGFLTALTWITIGDIAMAMLKLPFLALLMAVGVYAFAEAIKMVQRPLRGINGKELAIALGAIAIAVLATMAMTKAAQFIDPGSVLKASLGVLAGSLMILACMPFMLALLLISPLTSQLSPLDALAIAVAFAAMAVVAVALAVMVLAVGWMTPAIIGPAVVGLLTAALLVAVGGIAFGLALMAVGAVLSGVDFKSIALAFLTMAVVALSLVVVAAAAIAVGVLAIPAMIGLWLTAAFVEAISDDLLPALRYVGENNTDIPWKALGKVFLALIPIAMGLMIIAPMIAIAGIAAVYGMLGVHACGMFLGVITDFLLPSLKIFSRDPEFAKLKGMEGPFKALALIIGTVGLVALASLLLAPFMLVPAWLMDKGVAVIGEFLCLIHKHIVPPAIKLSEMKIANPDAFLKNMKAINELMSIVSMLGDIAVDLAEIELEAIEEGGSAASAMGPVTEFMRVLFPGIKGLITILIESMKNVTPSKLKMAAAIGDLVGNLGELIGAITGPMVEMAQMAMDANQTSPIFGRVDNTEFSKTMKTMGEFAGTLLQSLKDHLGPMIKGLLDIKIDMSEGIGSILDKVKVVGAVVKVAKIFMGMVIAISQEIQSMQKAHQDNKGMLTKIADYVMDEGDMSFGQALGQLTKIMDHLGGALTHQMPGIAKAMLRAASGAIPEGKVEETMQNIKAISEVIKIMGDMMAFMDKSMEMIKKVAAVDGDSWSDTIDWLFVDGSKWSKVAIIDIFTDAIGRNLAKFVTAINGIPDIEGIGPKLKAVSTSIKIMGEFVKAFSDIMAFMPEKSDDATHTDRLTKLFTSIDWIATAIGRGIGTIVSKLKTVADTIGNPVALKPKLEIISIIMKVVGDFTKAVSTVMGLMPKATDTVDLDRKVKQMFGGRGIMFKIIRRLAGQGEYQGIPQLVAAIKGAADKITNPVQAKAQMEVVSMAMKAVSDFASAIASIMALAPAQADAPHVTEGRLSSILATVSRVTGAISIHLPALVAAVKTSAETITNPKLLGRQMDVIGKIMEAVASFASAINSIQGIMPTPPPPGSTEKVKTVLEVIQPLACAISTHMPAVAKAIMGLFEGPDAGVFKKLHTYSRRIKVLGAVFGAVAKFSEAITVLQTMQARAGDATKLGQVIKDAKSSIVDNKTDIQKLVSAFAGIRVGTRFPKDSYANFAAFVTTGLDPVLTAINATPTIMETKLTTLKTNLAKLQGLVRNTRGGNFANALRVANALGGTGTVTVEGIPDKIELKIEVKLDATKLATKLGETGKLVVNTSDRRLKTGIEHVGMSDSGINIYEFYYVYDTETRWRGAMAQELLETHPDAVVIDEKGYYAVRYDKIDVEFEKVMQK